MGGGARVAPALPTPLLLGSAYQFRRSTEDAAENRARERRAAIRRSVCDCRSTNLKRGTPARLCATRATIVLR
jgi:hypothetical protein